MSVFRSLIDSEYKELQKFKKIANSIEDLDEEMQKLSDEELKNKTVEFIFAKFEDQNFNVSSRSIVFESSISIFL